MDVARTAATGDPTLVLLDGQDVDGRLDVAFRIAAELGLVPLVIRPVGLAPGLELAGIVRPRRSGGRAAGALPILDVGDDLDGGVAGMILDLMEAPVAVATGGAGGRSPDRLVIRRSVGLPSPAEQRALWTDWLGPRLSPVLETAVEGISQHFRLGARAVAGIARELATVDEGAGPVDIAAASRRRAASAPVSGSTALPSRSTRTRRGTTSSARGASRAAPRHRPSRPPPHPGLRALGLRRSSLPWAGRNGPLHRRERHGQDAGGGGLATDLDLDLYRIDLSATVSKYIGETEKIFVACSMRRRRAAPFCCSTKPTPCSGNAARSRTATIRYANLEVAYLLQRMESYRGLAILTTNMRSHIDRAFLRRLRFVIEFPFPDRGSGPPSGGACSRSPRRSTASTPTSSPG